MNEHFMQRKIKPSYELSLWQQFSGSLFLRIFGGIFLYFLAPEVLSYAQAQTWKEEQCVIQASKVQKIMDPGWKPEVKPVHYQLVIRYSYTRNKTQYTSSRYSFINPSTTGNRADEIVAKYPAGAKTTCFVNTNNPSEVVLNRSIDAFSLTILVPLPFFLLGVWGMVKFSLNLVRRIF